MASAPPVAGGSRGGRAAVPARRNLKPPTTAPGPTDTPIKVSADPATVPVKPPLATVDTGTTRPTRPGEPPPATPSVPTTTAGDFTTSASPATAATPATATASSATPTASAPPAGTAAAPMIPGGTSGGFASISAAEGPTGTAAASKSKVPNYKSPAPVTAETPVDPGQQKALTGWEKYNAELESGTAAETQRELQRYRDELSKGLGAEGEAAMARGADPSLFRSRALEGGKRGLLELQGRLADVSLGKRAEGLGGQTGAAGAAASERRMLHLGTLSAQAEAQRNLIAQAEAQARLNEAPYERLLKMAGLVGTGGGGLTGGGGGGGGGRGGGIVGSRGRWEPPHTGPVSPEKGGGLGGGKPRYSSAPR